MMRFQKRSDEKLKTANEHYKHAMEMLEQARFENQGQRREIKELQHQRDGMDQQLKEQTRII